MVAHGKNYFFYLLLCKSAGLLVSGSYMQLKAVENFGSDEVKVNQIVNYSVHKHEIPTNTCRLLISRIYY